MSVVELIYAALCDPQYCDSCDISSEL